MTHEIDALELQRLLDGRLTAAERAAFLECLGDDPQSWKAVALAFVEERALRTELQHMAGAALPTPTAPAASRGSRWLHRMTQFAVLTGVLTIGLLIGRSNLFNKSNAGEVARNSPSAPQPDSAKNRNDYYVVVTPADQPAPVQPAAGTDPIDSMMTPVFNQRVRDLVQGYGYRVEEEPVIYVIHDKKGDRYLIPQRRISFVPDKK